MKLENKGYYIYIDTDEIRGLMYDTDDDWNDYVNGCEEMLCSFVFVDDRYTTLTEYVNCVFTVEEHKEINWRKVKL